MHNVHTLPMQQAMAAVDGREEAAAAAAALRASRGAPPSTSPLGQLKLMLHPSCLLSAMTCA